MTYDNHWFVKYKLYHLPFWFAYHTVLWTFYTGSPSAVIDNIVNSAYSIKFMFYVIFQAFGVYFNLYFLIPRYLQQRKYPQYIIWVLLTIFITAALVTCGYFVSDYFSQYTFYELYQSEPNFYRLYGTNTLPSTVAAMSLGMCVKLTKNWLLSERKQKLIENEMLATELKFLKAQINPHFLFNTINSIFVLIHKNPDLASESLASFSNMLRFQLYECNESHIPLSKEIEFLENYTSLEKLRVDQSHTKVELDITGENCAGKTIAPLLLVPFVENAFKHVSKGKTQPNFINISINIGNSNLTMTVENSYKEQENINPKEGGIGLSNLSRRLNLIYGNLATFNVQINHASFTSTLKVPLS